MTAKEAKAISDKVMEERRFKSREFIENKVVKDIKAVASRGEYKIDVCYLSEVDVEVLSSEPYNYQVTKKDSGENWTKYHTVSWREVEPEFRLADI